MEKQFLFLLTSLLSLIIICSYYYFSETGTSSMNRKHMLTNYNNVHMFLKPPQNQKTRTYKKTFKSLSQVGQDKTVFNITKRRNGFFIEIGAYDGKTLSNSLWLEQQHNWTGLLIEANPDLCKAIDARNRNVWRLCACISNRNAEVYVKGGILGGNIDTLHPDIFARYSKANTIKVPCFDLMNVLDIIGKMDVDYISLDVEGAELNILESLRENLMSKLLTVSIWTIEFRIYDGNRNVDEASKMKLNKIRHFFDSIGGYFEYSILPTSLNDYMGLDIVFVSRNLWCNHNTYMLDKTKCGQIKENV